MQKWNGMTYRIEGEGERHFLLVHNSGGDHRMMGYSFDYFSKKGKTLAPDLLGHGASIAPKRDYTPEAFAKDLFELCRHEKMKEIIFIGLNYGASIGVALEQLYPGFLFRLILIEPAIFLEPWAETLVRDQIDDLQHLKAGWAEGVVNTIFVQASDKEREIALHALKNTPPFVKISTFQYLLPWDRSLSFATSVPTLIIQTTKPFANEEKARRAFARLEIGRVVGTGPWATLEVPEQIHPMIDRFLQTC